MGPPSWRRGRHLPTMRVATPEAGGFGTSLGGHNTPFSLPVRQKGSRKAHRGSRRVVERVVVREHPHLRPPHVAQPTARCIPGPSPATGRCLRQRRRESARACANAGPGRLSCRALVKSGAPPKCSGSRALSALARDSDSCDGSSCRATSASTAAESSATAGPFRRSAARQLARARR